MENKSVQDTMFRHYFNGGHGSGMPNMRLLSLVNAGISCVLRWRGHKL